MSNPFDRTYFEERSVYARFKDAADAVEKVSRWYHVVFRKVQKALRSCTIEGLEILEAGCGYAGLLKLFADAGAVCVGLDISEFVIEKDRSLISNVSFLTSTIEELRATGREPFDVVISLEMIEHLSNPEETLDGMTGLLRPGGLLVLSTPNRDCRVPGYRWDSDPTHISVRTYKAWRLLLESLGYTFIKSSTVLWLPAIWRFGPFFSRQIECGSWGPTCLFIARRQ